MKLSLSRSVGGGLGLPRRLASAVALAAVLLVPAGTAFAGYAVAAESAGPQGPATTAPAKPTLKIVVIGDSFTSGEGADPSTYRKVTVPATTEDGVAYQDYQIDPAHQSSTAPTLQALNQIQAANPGVDLQVSFVPVSGAVRDSLYQTTQRGTPFEQPPQINAVDGADVVIVGVGGNDAGFTKWIKTVLGSTETTSTQQFPTFMQQFNDGTYLNNQVKLLNDISDRAAPNATIISLGYPKAMPAEIPNSSAFWSPFSWSTISQGEAAMSNQLATTLSMNNQDASFIAAGAHSSQQWLYADVTTALQGHELFTSQEGLNGLTPSNSQGSYHPNDLGQRLLSSALQPYVEQAVNSQLSRQGVPGAQNVPAVTPTFSSQWNLRVQMPLQMQEQSQQQPDQNPNLNYQAPPAQDWPKPPTSPNTDQPAEPGNDQPADKPAGDQQTGSVPAQPRADQSQPAQPADAAQPGATQPGATQPDASQSGPPQSNAAQPGAAQPDGTQSGGSSAAPAGGNPAPADNPAPQAPADTPASPASPDASGAPAGTPADNPAAPAAQAPADTSAAAGQAPGGTPAAPADNPAVPAPADTPAAPAPADNPATPAAPPALADNPAAPGQAPTDTPAAPAAPADPPAVPAAPADTPAAPAAPAVPADTPAVPAAPADTPAAPAAPVDTPAAAAPAAPPVAVAPEPAPAPAPVPESPPAPIIDPISVPAPVIAPPPPVITPVAVPVDTGLSDSSGLGSDMGTGSDLGSGLDSGGSGLGADSGGVSMPSGDSGGD